MYDQPRFRGSLWPDLRPVSSGGGLGAVYTRLHVHGLDGAEEECSLFFCLSVITVL